MLNSLLVVVVYGLLQNSRGGWLRDKESNY
jgi:hypothetical protein